MSEGLHHFRFLYQRFLASTMGWPEDAQMGYIKLLIVQFERGFIPENLKEIAAISPSAKKHWNRIKTKFKCVTEEGHLYNSVMDGIRTEAIANYSSSIENGKKGGRPKGSKNKPAGYTINNPIETGRLSMGNPPGNPNPNPEERQPITNNELIQNTGEFLPDIRSIGLVPDMVSVFKESFPNYPSDPEKDFRACLAIGYKIAVLKNWDKQDVIVKKAPDVLNVWREICLFTSTHKWFQTRSISDLHNEWQRLMQSLGSAAPAETKQESAPAMSAREKQTYAIFEATHT